MKRFLAFVVFVIALVWGCNRCSDKESPKDDVLKEVTVSAKVANLRSGPGTNYAVISANADGSGGKCQVRRGTKLDVLSESGGWFKVRVPHEERTAYIKQSLCNDPTAKGSGKGSGSRKGRGASSDNAAASAPTESATHAAAPAPSVAPEEEEVVEITAGHASQDEVIY